MARPKPPGPEGLVSACDMTAEAVRAKTEGMILKIGAGRYREAERLALIEYLKGL